VESIVGQAGNIDEIPMQVDENYITNEFTKSFKALGTNDPLSA
jgi:hypothetical protein